VGKPQREKRHRYLEDLWSTQKGECFYCRKKLKRVSEVERDPLGRVQQDAPTLDHLHPQSRGGKWHISNLVMSCFRCNHIKSNYEIPTEIISDPPRMRKLFLSGTIRGHVI
jgi:5-methylcytosine-specific restriction endonuclease McrA